MGTFVSRLRNIFGSGTSGFDPDKYTFKELTYPPELDSFSSGQQHMVVFHIYERVTTQYPAEKVPGAKAAGGFLSNLTGATSTISKGISNVVANVPGAQTALNALPGNLNAGTLAEKAIDTITNASASDIASVAKNIAYGSQTVELKKTIILYMPSDYNASYNADWTRSKEMPIKGWLNVKSASDLMKYGAGAVAQSAGKALNDWFSSITDIDLKEAAMAQTGMIQNPWYEQLFEQMQFRTFNFNFQFRARTVKESETIRNICDTFKFYMHPEVATNLASRYLYYPSEFKIEFWSHGKENKYLNKIGRCVCTNMAVDYTNAGQWSAYRANNDGAPPVALGLQLQFLEVELVSKNTIADGGIN